MTEKAKNVLGLMEIDGFENVRYISINKGINGFEPWFVAKDVAEALGYKQLSKMYQLIDDRDKVEINPQTIQTDKYILTAELTLDYGNSDFGSADKALPENMLKIQTFEPNPKVNRLVIINEPALYMAIFNSKLPAARQFQDVVFREVLPSIRKYGYYISPKKLAEMEEKKQDIRNLAAEARHNMLLRKGVKYPDWFDADEGFVQWKEQMKQGLQEIATADGLKNHMAAFKAVKDKKYGDKWVVILEKIC
jgi:prophage antirepressor-like protein